MRQTPQNVGSGPVSTVRLQLLTSVASSLKICFPEYTTVEGNVFKYVHAKKIITKHQSKVFILLKTQKCPGNVLAAGSVQTHRRQ